MSKAGFELPTPLCLIPIGFPLLVCSGSSCLSYDFVGTIEIDKIQAQCLSYLIKRTVTETGMLLYKEH